MIPQHAYHIGGQHHGNHHGQAFRDSNHKNRNCQGYRMQNMLHNRRKALGQALLYEQR